MPQINVWFSFDVGVFAYLDVYPLSFIFTHSKFDVGRSMFDVHPLQPYPYYCGSRFESSSILILSNFWMDTKEAIGYGGLKKYPRRKT